MMNDPHDSCLAFLRPDELPIIAVMSDGEYVPPVDRVAENLGCDVKLVRATHRRMVELGYARTGPLVREEDGRLAGKGTWLNRSGYIVQDAVRAILEGPQP